MKATTTQNRKKKNKSKNKCFYIHYGSLQLNRLPRAHTLFSYSEIKFLSVLSTKTPLRSFIYNSQSSVRRIRGSEGNVYDVS